MTFFRRTRYVYWLFRDLGLRYTRYLVLGFVIGFLIATVGSRIVPLISHTFLTPVKYIGVVGDVTPASIPRFIQDEISSGLTKLEKNGEVTVGLSDWWEATDSGKLYVFHLKKGALWHNNKPIVAGDINYNIKNVTFAVIDNETLEARLEYPYSPFPVLVSKPLFKTGLVGSGIYKISRIVLKGENIKKLRLMPVLKNNKTAIKEYRFYTTEAQAINAYKLGEIDEIAEITNPRDLSRWGKDTIIEDIKYNRIVALYFNLKDKFVSDKNVRQGLGFALPVLSQERAISPISKISWAYTDKVKKYDPDPEQVSKLLGINKTATDSPELILTTFSTYLDIAQVIANSFTEAGIKTTVKVENTVPPDYQVLLTAVDIPPDPDQYPLWHSTQPGNITGYTNVKIDKLLEDGRQEMDPEKRIKIYADFARRITDDAPALFLYYPKTYSIIRGK